MITLKKALLAALVLTFSTGALADGNGLDAERLKLKPAEKINAKEPARPNLKHSLPAQKMGIGSRPQKSTSRKEKLTDMEKLKIALKKAVIEGSSGTTPAPAPQGCMNCNNP